MDCLGLRIQSLKVLSSVPNDSHCLLIVDSIEYTITAKNYEIVFGLNPKRFDLWRSNQHLRIASEFRNLGLNVAK